MLKVQELLKNNSIGDCFHYFNENNISFKIEEKNNNKYLLLDYNLLSSRNNEIVKECRGLGLKFNTWDIFRIGFKRFLNDGEQGCENISYNKYFSCEEKLDGTLILLHYIPEFDCWNVGTRGMLFPIDHHYNVGQFNGNFAELFWSFFKEENLKHLDKNFTYLFELCTPFNQVVIYHKQPKIYLTGGRHNKSPFYELKDEELDELNILLETKRPNRFFNFQDSSKDRNHTFTRKDCIIDFVHNLNGAEQEGVVVKQFDNESKIYKRVKLKNAGYCLFHKYLSHKNSSNIIELVLNDQRDLLELSGGFQEEIEFYNYVESKINEFAQEAENVYNENKWIFFHPLIDKKTRRKIFASRVMKTKYGNICFLLADNKISNVKDWIYNNFNTNSSIKKLIELLNIDNRKFYNSVKYDVGV